MAGAGDDSVGGIEQGRPSQGRHSQGLHSQGRHSQGRHSMKLRDSLTQNECSFAVAADAQEIEEGNVEGTDSDIEEIEESKIAPTSNANSGGANVLADFVTKVPEADVNVDENGQGQEVDLHR